MAAIIKGALLGLAILVALLPIWWGVDLYRDGITGLSEAEITLGSQKYWLKSAGPGLFLVIAGVVIACTAILQRIGVNTEETIETSATPTGTAAGSASQKRTKKVDSFGRGG